MTEWWLDEHAHAGAEHLDAGYVAGYERKAGYDASDDVAVLQRHGLDGTSTVVEPRGRHRCVHGRRARPCAGMLWRLTSRPR